jgi:hypothetical protein
MASFDGGQALCDNPLYQADPTALVTASGWSQSQGDFCWRCQKALIVYAQFAEKSKLSSDRLIYNYRTFPVPLPLAYSARYTR